jgi:integrase/recombinase XerD
MSELRNKMKTDLELRGYSPITVKYYIREVSRFAKHFNKSPELLGEDEIREYLHYCITEKQLSEGTVNYTHSALKFFYTKTLGRNWNMEKLARMKEGRKLPAVLSQSEVKAIFNATDNLKHKAILMTIYGAGLRVSEAANLKISDIDSKNMQIFIRQGKGKKDRYSLLSKNNLDILREYWKRYKPTEYLFPGKNNNNPVSVRTIQKIFEHSAQKAGIKKEASVHTLKHSFATHLLEAGTDICYIQRLLGHTNINTTTIYLHLRRMDLMSIKSPLETL